MKLLNWRPIPLEDVPKKEIWCPNLREYCYPIAKFSNEAYAQQLWFQWKIFEEKGEINKKERFLILCKGIWYEIEFHELLEAGLFDIKLNE